MVDSCGRGALRWLAPVVLLCALLAAWLGRSATPLDSTATLIESASSYDAGETSCDVGEAAPLCPPPCERGEDVVDDAEVSPVLASTGANSHRRASWLRSELVGPEYRTPPETPPPRG